MGLSESQRPLSSEGGALSPSLCEFVTARTLVSRAGCWGSGMSRCDACMGSRWKNLNYGSYWDPSNIKA